MKIHFAPIQGHTDAPYRYFHSSLYTPAEEYYTPFIRLEHGQMRKKDLNDLHSEITADLKSVPQVIFRDYEELSTLTDSLASEGFERIDINMGCPFPLQTAKGRGAATVGSRDCAEIVKRVVEAHPEIEFSIKMRLGMTEVDEWKETLPILNSLPLKHITMHPRVARQQYKGEPDLEAFGRFLDAAEVPVIYNGDLKTPEDVRRIKEEFPRIEGVMIGRGLLARPSLTSEIAEGMEWDDERRLNEMIRFHRSLMEYYRTTLCGDHQILSKIQPFWEYAEDEIGRKSWKSLKKAGNFAKYVTAVASIQK